MKKKIYKVKSKVWLYIGMAGWHFLSVDKKQSVEIKEKYGHGGRGFGSIPVRVTLGKSVWETSIFPDKQSGTYVLPLKAKVRRDEDIHAEDSVIFSFVVRL